MPGSLQTAFKTLGEHVGPALWALAVFACGFVLAFPVVRLKVESLLVLPRWLLRLARKYLRPEVNPILLFGVIFTFNTVAIFCYMISGGFFFMPILFDLFTGLNVGAVMLMDAEDELAEPAPDAELARPRAWVGFLSMFVVVVELSSFWLAIGMGIQMGHLMREEFSWGTFVAALQPRAIAYALVIVPALAASALAETAAVKAMLGTEK